MTTRLSLALSLTLHGAAFGTAWALGSGGVPVRPSIHCELQPSEDAVAIAEVPPPIEPVTVEPVDEPPPAQDPPEPTPAAVEPADFAPRVDAQFAPAGTTEASLAWLAALRAPSATPEPVAPVVESAPAPPAPSALVLEVIPGANPPPQYPWLARRRGWEGLVAIFVRVDNSGAVTTAAVARSSGHELLDAVAVEAVRTWRFRGGPGETTVEVEFALQDRVR